MSLNRTKYAWGEDLSFLTTHPKYTYTHKFKNTQRDTLSNTHIYKKSTISYILTDMVECIHACQDKMHSLKMLRIDCIIVQAIVNKIIAMLALHLEDD